METRRSIADFQADLADKALSPLMSAGRWYYITIAVLAIVFAWGLYAYFTQLRTGLIVTGMRDRIMWGLYISLFVFFIGISHAGTLISAILRVSKAGWRTPITRMAEFITVVALMVGGLMPLIDMGRPERVLNMVWFGRFQSPLIWDMVAITTYLTGSLIYLYLPLIPDLAIVRDRIGPQMSPPRRFIYRVLSIGWRNTEGQRRDLHVGLGMMMILIIPVAVSVHTVVSWIFAMTLREPWDNPMFGAFFVAGAIYSGIAALVLLMAILRKAYHLEEYITPQHFINLGYMLAGFSLIMMYFNALEFVTMGFKLSEESTFHIRQMLTGELAWAFWTYALGGLVLPGLIILVPFTRNLPGVLVASVLILIGMWLERFFIVVGGARVPLMPYTAATYSPTWVEWSIMAGAFAFFGLIICVFIKIVPVVSIWEISEHYEEERITIPRKEFLENETFGGPTTEPAAGDD